MDSERLFRTIVHALRHDPWKYGLELDEQGFVPLAELVVGLRFDRYDWALLECPVVEKAVRMHGKTRLELRNGFIRATYGHSILLGEIPPVESPPAELLHGTTLHALPLILRDGILPMGRRFVHLTPNRDYAFQVAQAKRCDTILAVRADRMESAGYRFRKATEKVWLTERVDPGFLAVS